MTASTDRAQTIRFPGRVVILGNDLVAWMTAAMVSNRLSPLKMRVTVVEDDSRRDSAWRSFASTPALVRAIHNLGCDEHDLMRACGGTYRLATQYSDWSNEGRDFWCPIPSEEGRIEGMKLFEAWLMERAAGRLLRPLHSYSLHWSASLAGKSPHSFSGHSPFAQAGAYGFHGTQSGAARWFRKLSMDRGVERLTGTIDRVFPNGRGGVAQVRLADSMAVPGDLFIDCRDCEKPAHDEWTSWEHRFLCDRLASISLPRDRHVPVFSRVLAQPSGWLRLLPLSDGTDVTYAFSSAHEEDDAAHRQLRNTLTSQLGVNPGTNCLPESQSVHFGRRRTFWTDNVVHLGQSACQLDPLAGTEVHLHMAGIENLIELFPDRKVGAATRAEFNSRMSRVVDEAADFVQAHYVMSHREDSEYLRNSRDAPQSSTLTALLELYDATGNIRVRNAESMPEGQYRALFAGAGRLPQRTSLTAAAFEGVQIQRALRDRAQDNEAAVKDLPTHEELLEWVHAGPFGNGVHQPLSG